ncbi:MAG: hypothetical protein ACFCU1_01610 [Sumerlaeia bacterium]
MTNEPKATPSVKNNNETADFAEVESSDAPPGGEYVYEKPASRVRAEEIFLWVARIILMGAIGWAGFYAWWSLTKSPEELLELAETTAHDSLMFGATILLGAELSYYLYLSASFRKCREWGMVLWGIGLLILAVNLRFSS